MLLHRPLPWAVLLALIPCVVLAQSPEKRQAAPAKPAAEAKAPSFSDQFPGLDFRNIGPFRGGRSVAVTGVRKLRIRARARSTGIEFGS